ncbi:MAG: hypothetical protein LKCHEGNO_00962 [Burkholderiaceae bacterium]|nr:hypothetical protein [Burkholderiaceae bacterium]
MPSARRGASSGCTRSDSTMACSGCSSGPGGRPCSSRARADSNAMPATKSQSQSPSSDPATASAKRSSLARSASTARLRCVMSTVAPAIRVGVPAASWKHWPRLYSQRTSPLSGRTMRNSCSSRSVSPATWRSRARRTDSTSSECSGSLSKYCSTGSTCAAPSKAISSAILPEMYTWPACMSHTQWPSLEPVIASA